MGRTPEIDDEVLRLIDEGDLDGLWRHVGRRMQRSTKTALEEFVGRELDRADAARLVALWEEKVPEGRRVLVKHLSLRLKDERSAEDSVAAIETLLARDPKGASELFILLITNDVVPLEDVRALVTDFGSHPYRVGRVAVFALVRRGGQDWLLERLRAGELTAPAVALVVEAAAVLDDKLGGRLARVAGEVDDATLLAQVLSRFDVARSLVEKGVQCPDHRARAAAMRHVHRLRDPRPALESALTDPETDVRRAALEYLLERPDPKLRDYVEALVDDPDPYDDRHNPQPVGTLARLILRKL